MWPERVFVRAQISTKSFPFSLWCKTSGYELEVGSAWKDFWSEAGKCNSRFEPTVSPSASPTTSPTNSPSLTMFPSSNPRCPDPATGCFQYIGVGYCRTDAEDHHDVIINPNSNEFTDEECRAVCPVINLRGVSKGSGNCLCYYDDGLAPSIIPAGFFDLSDNYSGTGPITKTNLAEDGATCFVYHPAE
eukprot:scaffold88768_cov71-Cyclotella_meneghiniana.AAC.2